MIPSGNHTGEPVDPAHGNGLPLVEQWEKVDGPLKNHLKRQGGDRQIEMLQTQGRQTDEGPEHSANRTRNDQHQRPCVSDEHMGVSYGPSEHGQSVRPHPHERGMSDRNQAGESGHQVQTNDRHHGDEDIVEHQHIFIADLVYQRPDEKHGEKDTEQESIQMGKKDALLFLVTAEKIACGQPAVCGHRLYPFNFMSPEQPMRFE